MGSAGAARATRTSAAAAAGDGTSTAGSVEQGRFSDYMIALAVFAGEFSIGILDAADQLKLSLAILALIFIDRHRYPAFVEFLVLTYFIARMSEGQFYK